MIGLKRAAEQQSTRCGKTSHVLASVQAGGGGVGGGGAGKGEKNKW